MHEVRANEPGESERTVDKFVCSLSHPEEEEGNQGGCDLDSDGVVGCAEEVGDFERLLDPAEEKLDFPTALIEIGDLLCRGVEIVCDQAQDFAGLNSHHDLTKQ